MRPAAGFDLAEFKRLLQALPPGAPLWTQLLALLDAYVLSESVGLASPGLDDAEAHRFRGRIGMLLDLKAELDRLHRESIEELKGGMTRRK